MSLTHGTRLGVYDIVAPIGEGGMGQVFRARDTRLDRDVAIKILPEAFAHDADRLARFTREARTLAQLNHPHIAQIHGLEESGGVTALVMELVEGEDLSQRIARGAIPIDEALPIAKQIAEALEAAHEQGIVHRDLKPANIKVRPDGTVKVLDFGLAKAMEPAAGAQAGTPGGAGALLNSPTITSPAQMTGAGVILGTAAYMSPEQARGRVVDRRADIWAFGCVLYEMLTGRRAFPGEDVTETIANVINKEPVWDALPPSIPAHVHQTLRLCLKKPIRARVPDIGAARLALEGAFETVAPQMTASAPASLSRGRRPLLAALAVAAVVIAALAVPALRHLRESPPSQLSEVRLDIVAPTTDEPASFALSPDGRQIVFAATTDGGSRLWLRTMARTTAQPLPGTEGAVAPFWAPDSRSIGFFSGGSLKRLDLGGDAPQTLTQVNGPGGGTWNADGLIVFVEGPSSPLMRIAAFGGTTANVTTLRPQHSSHWAPFFLPDGRRFLFYVTGESDTAGIYLGSLDGDSQARLTSADGGGVYLPSGWLVWAIAGTLRAQRLDVTAAALVGAPVTLADGVAVGSGARSAISVTAAGLLAYRSASGNRQLVWVDRTGKVLEALGEPDSTLLDPRVAPDGRRVLVARTVQGNMDIWLLQAARTSRVTFDPAPDRWPIWSPDGTRIVFRSQRTGVGDLYQKDMNAAGTEERVVSSVQLKVPNSWSGDGRFVLYSSTDPQTNADLWVVPMVGAHTPSEVLKTPFREAYGSFSPDSRWVAYTSIESGRPEIYVRRFSPGTPESKASGHWQVSTAGGIHPVWSPDGRELYYLNPAGAMMAAPIAAAGTALEPGAPVVLFQTHIFSGGVDAFQNRQYDVSRDGRFLINTVLDEVAAPITLIQNWNPEAKK